MSNQYGPRIVTNGLVLCLDAGNSKSYPGSGTAWNDLASNISGSLVNSPIYSSNDKGYFTFDGVDEYYSVVSGIPARTNTLTNDIWVYPTSLTGGENGNSTLIRMPSTVRQDGSSADFIFTIQNIGGPLARINTEIRNLANTGYQPLESSTIISANKWYNIVQVINTTAGNFRLYVNGVLIVNRSIDIYTMITSGAIQIAQQGTNTASAFARRLTGRVASVKLYGTALSASEVLQNYNATKGRFGL